MNSGTAVRRLLHPGLLLFVASLALFWLFPQIDLAVSGWFHDPELRFYPKNAADPDPRPGHWLFGFLYWFAPRLDYLFAALLILGLILSAGRRFPSLVRERKRIAYLLLVLALGPGLLVNSLLKEHSGRARPADIREFGGGHVFTPAGVPADQCTTNCSFVCGHCSAGFYFIALGFVSRHRRRWFAFGVLYGSLVSLARIAQGGHFLSDAVLSFFAVYLTAALLHHLMFRHALPPFR